MSKLPRPPQANPPRVELLFQGDKDLEPEIAQRLASVNPEFDAYAFKFESFPLHKEIIFSMRRPVIADKYYEKKRFTVTEKGNFLKDNKKTFFVYSNQGYLPGETIHIKFETADGEFLCECAFEPCPIVIKDKSEKKQAKVELLTSTPAFYRIKLENPKKIEKIKMISKSGVESLSSSFDILDGMIMYTPDAKATSAASCVGNLRIIRDSGEAINFRLAWGEQFEECLLKGKRIPY